MLKKQLLLLFITLTTGAFAETIKTDVLVVGGTASGTAAAIQSARSKVKTMLVEEGPWLGGEMTSGGMCILDGNRALPSGIWAEFRRKVREFYRKSPGFDTTATAPLKFEPYTGAAVLKKICDTVKNLTLRLNTTFNNVRKNGNGWEVDVVMNGKPVTIKSKVLIDATPTADVVAKAGAAFSIGFDAKAETNESLAPEKAIPTIEDITWVAIVKDYGKDESHVMAKPDDYDASRYADLKGKDIKKMLQGGRLYNDKYMIKWGESANTFGATAKDLSPENREAYYKTTRLHVLGLIYYLQTELGFKNIAIDPTEFGTPDHLPSIPYIREYRRAKGQVRMTLNEIYTPYVNKLYRTSIAVGDATFGQHYSDPAAPKTNYPSLPGYSVPLGSVIVKDAVNLLVTEKGMATTHLVNASTFYPSVQMCIGQGAGAVAAYCAFYSGNGKTTKNIDVRSVQGELLDFKALLYPYNDLAVTDKFYRSVQQITATGLLREVQEAGGKSARVLFKPDSTVNTAQVKASLSEIYTRAFIWFGKNKTGELFTVGDLVSYISDYTLTEPKTLQLTLQTDWQEKYQFKQPFDAKRPVTRYEFAVLMNKYLNPFARTYNIRGELVN